MVRSCNFAPGDIGSMVSLTQQQYGLDQTETTQTEVKLVAQLQSRRVEGLVVCPVGTQSEHLVQADAAGVPLIVVDRCFPETALTSVMSDNPKGAAMGIESLLRSGHKIVGCLQGLPGTLSNETRLAAVRESFRDAAMTFDKSLVAGDNFTEQSGYLAAKSLLSNRPDITALFAFSTPNAFGALRAARELGRTVPDDLSLITFDHSPAGNVSVADDGLTTFEESAGGRDRYLIIRDDQKGRTTEALVQLSSQPPNGK